MANPACILPCETKELKCRLSDKENTLGSCSVVPAMSMVNGLVAPDAVYFTSPDDGICWLRVTNEGACAMEFDATESLYCVAILDGLGVGEGGGFLWQICWSEWVIGTLPH